MKVIKKINNNVALCLDNNDCELIAIGAGIGFQKIPYELTDLSKIERTFYGVNSRYIELINEIPEQLFILTAKTIDYASTLVEYKLSSNLLFTLADHINFAIERHNDNIPISMSIYNDIRHLHKSEVIVGEHMLRLIKEELNIDLSPDESIGIAMHLINNYSTESSDNQKETQIIADITEIIENDFNLFINKTSITYARFSSHIQYFIRRENSNKNFNTENLKIFESVKNEYPKVFNSAKRIADYIKKHYGWELKPEEILYIMLHINRICAREDCYQ